MRCVDCRNQMLDLAYGLLDPAEAAALESHVATCPACAAAKAAAAGEQVLIAKAAKVSFPQVRFVPPVEGLVEPKRRTARATLVRWAVAAGVLLAVAGTVGPSIQSGLRSAAAGTESRASLAAVRYARENWANENAAYARRKQSADSVLESAANAHDALVTEWVSAETVARNAKAFAVDVTGPASAVAGAANDYRIRVADASGQPVAAAVAVTVTDSAGKVRAEASYDPTAVSAGTTFRLPAAVWADLPAGTGLTLAVTATDPKTGLKSKLAEPINLLPPVYSTFLTTDRPLYQPGDTLYFRSLTLDRTRFLPPDRDLNLRYELLDAKGIAVRDLSLIGRSSPASVENGQPVPIPGPDGKPVRGVGTGAFVLPATLPPGEYTLVVHELPDGWVKSELPAGSVPLARRKVQVHKVAASPSSLTFSAAGYGPGDTVIATLTATRQGRPLSNAQIMASAVVDGKRIADVKAPPLLDAAGKATVEFTLPKDPALNQAEVRVTILDGESEVVTKSVPLALKSLGVDFFPEGGDLVAGVEGRVYFRARTADGKPVEFRGEVYDGEKSVAAATTVVGREHPGMFRGLGMFAFTPEAGKRYVLRGPAGEFPLPAVKTDGVSLSIPVGVVGPAEPITVRLGAAKAKKSVVVGAYSRGRPVASARVTLEPGKVTPVVLQPETGSPGGVTRVTVFEEDEADGPGRKALTPVAERLMFRRPAESLALTYTRNAGPLPTGSPVNLTVHANRDGQAPTGAVLWVAVVNESVFGTADDRTGRGLPAHFYVCGEVEKPDDLEFADFLLTDHPKAAESLDLVLGTQGWRRFAEQAPEVFRKTAPPDEADRLLVAVGSRGPVPAEYRPLVERVTDRYRPQYDRVREQLESAERSAKVDSVAAEASRQSYSTALAGLAQVQAGRRSSEEWAAFRVPVAIGLLILTGVLVFVRSRYFRPADPERKYLAVACVVGVGLAGFLITAAAVRPVAEKSDVDEEWTLAGRHGVTYSAANPYGRPVAARVPVAGGGPGTVGSPLESVRQGTPSGAAVRSFAATTPPAGIGSPLETAAGMRTALKPGLSHDPTLHAQLTQGFANGIENRLPPDLSSTAVGRSVREAIPKLPPLIVREYIHTPRDQRYQLPGMFDAADTVLWRPVVVVPNSGSVGVSFQLSGGTTGYRVLIAGHTLDGRVGSVSGFLPVESLK